MSILNSLVNTKQYTPRLVRHHIAVLAVLSALWHYSTPVLAYESPALQHVENAQLVGKARFKVMLWKLFDAELYAPNGQLDIQQPFALSLTYLRKFKSDKIVESTLSELRAQGMQDTATRAEWGEQLRNIFPDVSKGSNITAVRDNTGKTLFYCDGRACGTVSDSNFTNRFFDIWLGESTSKPAFRLELLKLKQ